MSLTITKGAAPTAASAATPAEALEAEMDAVLPAPSMRRVALASALALTVGVGGMVGWAAATPLDRAVIGYGALIAEGKRKTVTLLEPGILRDLLVREGERVSAGQPLLRLDTTQAEAAADQARALYWGQATRAARLVAEGSDRRRFDLPDGAVAAAAADPAVAGLVEAERRLFAARWAAFDGAVGAQRARVAQLGEQAMAMAAQRAATATRLNATRQELAGVSRLVAQGYATRTRLWELQRNEAELLGNLGQFQAQEAQTREQIAGAQAELANLALNRQQDAAKDLQEARALLADADGRLRGAQDILNRREVVSPEPGTVTDIKVFTPGSSIAAGAPVLDLVPLEDRLVAEVQIALNDIENVRIGQTARVRLSAYRSHELPLLDGRVIYVSADRQTDPQGTAYFLARVEFDAAALAEHARGGAPVNAGMPAEAYLIGERRTALDYVVRPLRDSLRRSLRD